ncbi:MAG: hypothetical protein COA61_000280 [Zetaproteobacteria bacterium]|nr:hypothetical protein [Zetaproteobacteria bacterium]
MRILGLLSLMMMLCSTLASASDVKETVSVRMDAYQIVIKKDVEKRLPAKAAKPGDVLEYIAIYHNNTSHGVSDLKGTLPIPVGMIYMKGSERPRHALASLDGVSYKPMPLMRRVKQADGRWKKVKVPLIEYRFLRWDLNVLKGEKSKKVSARMQIIPLK